MLHLASRSLAVLLLPLALGCGSSDGDKPVVSSFQSSGCKAPAATPAAGEGRCVSFSVAGNGDLTFTLSDFAELCGVPESLWKADATFADGELGVKVLWDFPTPNACGSCLYDFSFVVAKVPTEKLQRIRLATQGCSGDCGAHAYRLDLGATGLGSAGPFCGARIVPL